MHIYLQKVAHKTVLQAQAKLERHFNARSVLASYHHRVNFHVGRCLVLGIISALFLDLLKNRLNLELNP